MRGALGAFGRIAYLDKTKTNGSMPEYNIDSIVDDIAAGRCVLFLGPELLVDKEGRYYKAFFKELARNNEDKFRYFPKENLFAVSGAFPHLNRRALVDQINSFYKEAGDEIMLNLIAQIPFSLIINVAPDMGINEVFRNNGYRFHEAHFPDATKAGLPPSASSEPIIYNIFGCAGDPRSLILTHDDLFKSVKALMQKDSLPAAIYNALQNADSFLFLGLQFETWYYQLLLSILEIDKSPSVRIGAPYYGDSDTVSVMNSYFQISFTDNKPLRIIQDIYDQLAARGGQLRAPVAEPPQTAAYFSYAWKDGQDQHREVFVDHLYNDLANGAGVRIFRDRNVLTIQDSIESFMNRIGRGKAVIIVVSDKYLRSEYCMYEAWQIYKNDNFKDRVFIAVLPDVDRSQEGIDGYIKYWIDRKDKLGAAISGQYRDNVVAIEDMVARSRNIMYIYLFVGQFLRIINDTIHYQVPQPLDPAVLSADAGFANFTRLIVEKLKEADAVNA
ncbi:MAG: TIR domain-containing protein [Chitinophagaceae bacterium]|nr:MAG: TIR domain-containing protein [Chitinophagaceae bacterium]